jgi:hypothetical protein
VTAPRELDFFVLGDGAAFAGSARTSMVDYLVVPSGEKSTRSSVQQVHLSRRATWGENLAVIVQYLDIIMSRRLYSVVSISLVSFLIFDSGTKAVRTLRIATTRSCVLR